jgi:acyl dehydratase
VPRYEDVTIGAELPPQTCSVRRVDLVRYCGASGDFNAIHWNERTAKDVGLPDVIAHGMFTMAKVASLVTGWAGSAAVIELGVRFRRPVPVPDDDDGVQLTVSGQVLDKLDGGRVVLGLSATVAGEAVLSGAQAVVRLD